MLCARLQRVLFGRYSAFSRRAAIFGFPHGCIDPDYPGFHGFTSSQHDYLIVDCGRNSFRGYIGAIIC